jgi:hypothetical protein
MEENKKNIVSCKIAAALISKSLEQKLSIKESVQLKTHLAICKTCVFYSNQIQALRQIFNKYSQTIIQLSDTAVQTLCEAAKKRIKSAIQENI